MPLRIREIRVGRAVVPLKRTITHATTSRSSNETLIVRCELSDGSVGWGEGLPREYVTGETIDTAFDSLITTLDEGCPIGCVSSLVEAAHAIEPWHVAGHEADPRHAFGNAARCGVELAYLDAVGRSTGESVHTLAAALTPDVAETFDEVRYGMVFTPKPPLQLLWRAFKVNFYGLLDGKLKVGVPGTSDRRSLQAIRRGAGGSFPIRLDGNEAWPVAEIERRFARLRPFDVGSIEQPCPHGEVAGLAAVRRSLGCPIMLDESLCSMTDAQHAVEHETCDLFNIRVSKCGGLVPSLRLASFAAGRRIGVQLGCQVGETGILSAAGRAFATSVAGLKHREGSYDRHLVAAPLTAEDLTFRRGGRADRLTGGGLGITIDEDAVAAVVREFRSWKWA